MSAPNSASPAMNSGLLERYVRSGLLRAAASTHTTITRRASDLPVPLALEQVPLWRFNQLHPDVAAHAKCVTMHLPGALDSAVLEASLTEIITRHEAWRTTFSMADGQPIQVVHPAAPIKLPTVDLRNLPKAQRWSEALRVAREDFKVPFDLATGPLLRATLVRLDETEHLLFLSLHYMIFDGVSLYHVFLKELRARYEAYAKGQPAPLPPLPIQYSDYARWQHSVLLPDVVAKHVAYWAGHLAGAPERPVLPADYSPGEVKSFRGAMRSFALSQALSDALKALARREGVTLYVALLAAFKTLLHLYSGQEDLVISTRTGSRKRPELAGLLGYFVSTPPIRTDLAGDPPFTDFLRRVRQSSVDALAHDEVPFGYFAHDLRPRSAGGQGPFGQVVLTFEPSLPALPSGWTLTQLEVEIDALEADLFLELDDRPQGIIGCFEYNCALFDAATISRMVEHWQIVLESIVADPSRQLSQLAWQTKA